MPNRIFWEKDSVPRFKSHAIEVMYEFSDNFGFSVVLLSPSAVILLVLVVGPENPGNTFWVTHQNQRF